VCGVVCGSSLRSLDVLRISQGLHLNEREWEQGQPVERQYWVQCATVSPSPS
jgi:hypothetical protein